MNHHECLSSVAFGALVHFHRRGATGPGPVAAQEPKRRPHAWALVVEHRYFRGFSPLKMVIYSGFFPLKMVIYSGKVSFIVDLPIENGLL